MLEMQVLGGLGGLSGIQEKANCLPLLPLNLTHYFTLPLAAGKNRSIFMPKFKKYIIN